MSISALNWAFSIQGITPGQKLVLIALSDHANQDGVCWPSIDRLEKTTCLQRRSVTRILEQLEQSGLVSRDRSLGGKTSTHYNLSIGRDVVAPSQGPQVPTVGTSSPPARDVRSPEPLLEPKKEITPLKDIPPLKIPMPRAFVRTPFELFWEAYPRHVGRAAAEMSFIKALKRGHDPGEIVRKAAEFKAHCERNAKPIQFIPHPSTWLNQCRWNDELVDDQPEVRNGRQNAKEELLKWAFSEDEPVVEHAPGDLTILPGGDAWDAEGQGGSIFDVPKRIRGPCG